MYSRYNGLYSAVYLAISDFLGWIAVSKASDFCIIEMRTYLYNAGIMPQSHLLGSMYLIQNVFL